LVSEGPIKFGLKLEATYGIPNNSIEENRTFKTNARELYQESDIHLLLKEEFQKLLLEEEEYAGKGSGYTLLSIDGILINVNKFKPIGGSFYIK